MSKLNLNLDADSMVEIILHPTETATVEQQFTAIKAKIVSEVEPVLKKYLEDLHLKDNLQKINSIEELEAMQFEYIPRDVKKTLAHTIEELPDLSEGQATYLFTLFLGSYHESSVGFINSWCKNRAQEIVNFKKRIIT